MRDVHRIVDPVYHPRIRTRALGVQHADREDLDVWCATDPSDNVVARAEDPRDVRPVTVRVARSVARPDLVDSGNHRTRAEVLVRAIHPSVEDRDPYGDARVGTLTPSVRPVPRGREPGRIHSPLIHVLRVISRIRVHCRSHDPVYLDRDHGAIGSLDLCHVGLLLGLRRRIERDGLGSADAVVDDREVLGLAVGSCDRLSARCHLRRRRGRRHDGLTRGRDDGAERHQCRGARSPSPHRRSCHRISARHLRRRPPRPIEHRA